MAILVTTKNFILYKIKFMPGAANKHGAKYL